MSCVRQSLHHSFSENTLIVKISFKDVYITLACSKRSDSVDRPEENIASLSRFFSHLQYISSSFIIRTHRNFLRALLHYLNARGWLILDINVSLERFFKGLVQPIKLGDFDINV